jgi:tetratricopeptide (TPR) repeat protein
LSIFNKLFPKAPPSNVSPAQTNSDPASDPNMIRVFDKFGKEMFIAKQDWRDKVLPGNLQQNWNNPDELYSIIVSSLNDGFRTDIIKASEHLYKIDSNFVRGACIWGIVLMEEGRLDEAEKVFSDYVTKHGLDGVILTNLAKVYSRKKDDKKAEETLLQGLQIDPNQDNGLGWYEVMQREKGGEAAGLDALRKIAELPASWRAQLWLARAKLAAGNLDEAVALYEQSLSRVGENVPSDLLMQMSGDLGNKGHLKEILQLCTPRFSPELHGIQVGNNLIKANIELGNLASASEILNQLYKLKRPDWNETLRFWEIQIAESKTKVPGKNTMAAPLEISFLEMKGPVWLKPASQAAAIFPNPEATNFSISFLGCTAEVESTSNKIQLQMPNAAGRMSRALPLFLAEQLHFTMGAHVQTLVPWISSADGGFVLSGVPWKDEIAVEYTKQGSSPSKYLVTVHLKTKTQPWIAETRLLNVVSGKLINAHQISFTPENPEKAILELAEHLRTSLMAIKEKGLPTISPYYQVPRENYFGDYLLRLEQLLAVRCASLHKKSSDFLSGEREIVNGNILLSLASSKSVSTRVLLAQTLHYMKLARPDIIPEFKEKIILLQKNNLLPEPAQETIQKMLDETFES